MSFGLSQIQNDLAARTAEKSYQQKEDVNFITINHNSNEKIDKTVANVLRNNHVRNKKVLNSYGSEVGGWTTSKMRPSAFMKKANFDHSYNRQKQLQGHKSHSDYANYLNKRCSVSHQQKGATRN